MIEYPSDQKIRSCDLVLAKDRERPDFQETLADDAIIIGTGKGGAAKSITEAIVYLNSADPNEIAEARAYVKRIRGDKE